MDVARLRTSFDYVSQFGDELALYFYSRLFLHYPETREMFPVSMAAQRTHLLDALEKIIVFVDHPDELTVFLQDLGIAHRRFEVRPAHFDAVGSSLLATLEHFSGDGWTTDVAKDWAEAYGVIAKVMTDAMTADAKVNVPWSDATVVSSEWRSFDVAVVFATVPRMLRYKPGQSVPVEISTRPRLWRYFSLANPPRADRILEFHVRVVDGGAVSMAFANLASGATLKVGRPQGALTLQDPDRKVLMVAGSTGLAPLKAIIGQIAGLSHPPAVRLFFSARNEEGLYDLPAIEKLAAGSPWLSVTPVITRASAVVSDAVVQAGDWSDRDVYVSGPAEMVRDVSARLAVAGVPREQVHVEDFGWSEPA